MTDQPHFGRELFKFLVELAGNNNREWFNANKERYDRHVREPFVCFIADFAPRLRSISPHFLADPRPTGGSLFRIYRDIRFSKDKSPYKTHAAAHFPHRGTGGGVHSPGFYLHLAPGASFAAGGIWHPDSATLDKVRTTIVKRAKAWEAVRRAKLSIEGDILVRPPKGYDPNHPFIEDLKRRDFVCYLVRPGLECLTVPTCRASMSRRHKLFEKALGP